MTDIRDISGQKSQSLVRKNEISIFSDAPSREVMEAIEFGQKVVFITIGPGETHVRVLDDTGRSLISWTAVFGWSSLCDIPVVHNSEAVRGMNQAMIVKALRQSLRIYGQSVDTEDFVKEAKAHFRSALIQIMDRTIGDAKEYDKIVLSSPEWLHIALEDCLRIRPHISPDIQDS